jgi:hypothetical protein
MGIGAGIFLIVVGAILSFAVSDHVSGVDLTVVGYICMGAGALALILAIVLTAQRANTSHREVVERRDLPPARRDVVERDVVQRDVPPTV